MVTSIDRLLSPDYLDGLGGFPMPALRGRRDECQEVETGLSYFRRLIQGRLDIVHTEQARRAEGDKPTDLAHLIEALPAILAEHLGGSSRGPLPEVVAPEHFEEMAHQLDDIVDADRLTSLPNQSDDALAVMAGALVELERTVSSQRRALHERIDTLQAEIVQRYKSGQATVDALLR
jgi:hypothetical protein